MKIKKLCAVALLLLLSFYAKAQNWQAYKGVWLKGYDNAAQAPVPPSGYSALTYFADSLGTYVYDWDSLAWLRIPGAGSGGGGGGLMTADNGLSVNPAGNVRLGGALLASTDITGTGTQNLNFGTTTNRLNSFGVRTDNNIFLERQETATLFNRLSMGQSSSSFNVQFSDTRKSTYTFAGVNAFFDVMDNAEKVRLDLRTSSNNEILLTSDSSSVISRFRVLPDKIRLESDNIYLSKSPVELDTAVWFLARDFNTGAIVQRKASGGGGGMTADNGLNVDPAGNIRIGTASLPGFVEDDGAVFSTDSLNIAGSHFWFMPDSVQIGNFADLGEGPVTAYLLMKGGLLSGHTPTSSFQLQPGGTNTMSIFWGTAPLFSFGSTRLRFGSASLAPAVRFFEVANGDLLQYTSSIGSDMAFQTMDGATGTESTGDILIRTGAVTSGTGAVGNIEIRLGSQAGSGSGGTLQLDPSTGFLTIVNIPTADPCGSAPTGTVWSDSGTLKVCP